MDERIRNHREKPYTMVSNDAIANTSLSVGARGLYAIIQYFADKPNWELKKKHLREQCPDLSQSAFERMWAELIRTGYLKKTCVRKDGKFYYEYELYEVGNPEQAEPEPKKTQREIELEQENETLRREIERLKGNAAAESHPPTFLGGGNTVCQGSDIGNLKHSIHKTEDIHNTINTPNPQNGASEGDQIQRHSKYESVMEPLEEYLPEDVQKDGKHVRKLGSKLKDLSTETRVSFLTAATRIFEDSNTDIASPLAYYSKILDNIIDDPKKAEPKNNQKSTKKQPTFCDFEQRNYDYDDLLKKLGHNG